MIGEPGSEGCGIVAAVEAFHGRPPQPRHRLRQLIAAARRLADPERNVGRLSARVLDQYLALLDPEDAVRGVAELEDVAGQAFEGEILVEVADDVALGLQDDLVVEQIRNGAGVGQGGQARAAACAQPAVDAVAMQPGAAPAAPRGVALGEHSQHGIPGGIVERGVAVRATHDTEQRRFLPFAARHLGDHMLGQHIERRRRHADAIQFAAVYRVEQGGAFQQFVA